MSDDLAVNRRTTQAALAGAQGMGQQPAATVAALGAEEAAYQIVSALNPPKAAFVGYEVAIMAAIVADPRNAPTALALNQATRVPSNNAATIQGWLAPGGGAIWVHCYNANDPNPRPYRAYVCADLSQAGVLLGFLLAGYPPARPLRFKVASYDEARTRNDTFVSWHQTLADARAWIGIAANNPLLLNGRAPPGTFGGYVDGVGIDREVAGQSTTGNVAKAAVKVAVAKNPYI